RSMNLHPICAIRTICASFQTSVVSAKLICAYFFAPNLGLNQLNLDFVYQTLFIKAHIIYIALKIWPNLTILSALDVNPIQIDLWPQHLPSPPKTYTTPCANTCSSMGSSSCSTSRTARTDTCATR